MNVVPFPRPVTIDELWQDYASLIRSQLDDTALLMDRNHVQATVRAYQRFAEAYGRSCA